MRLLRSRQGKVALELHGNNIIHFLCISSEGPQFDASERRSFFAEYNTVLDMQPFDAILSFICAAKRAYRHKADVCNFLWEQIMAKNFSDMSLAELISVYNKLAVSNNKGQRKSFSSKAEAITAIGRLDALVKEPTVVQLQNQGKIMTQTVDENGNVVEAAEKKPRGKGIGKRAMELILEGKTNLEVIEVIKAEIEGANPTPATMAWYRNKLRQEGKLAPSNRKSKGDAAEVEVEAEDEAEDEAA